MSDWYKVLNVNDTDKDIKVLVTVFVFIIPQILWIAIRKSYQIIRNHINALKISEFYAIIY